MHHWPGPGCWLSGVTREPDTWNSGSGNFLGENSFIFCLDVYPLPKIAATSRQRRLVLCLLHTEVAKSFWTPHCIAFFAETQRWVPKRVRLVLAESHTFPHVLLLLLHCRFQLGTGCFSFLCPLRLVWSGDDNAFLLPAGTCPHLLRPHWVSLTCDDSEHTIASCPADSLFALTCTEADTWGPGSCGTAVPVG